MEFSDVGAVSVCVYFQCFVCVCVLCVYTVSRDCGRRHVLRTITAPPNFHTLLLLLFPHRSVGSFAV